MTDDKSPTGNSAKQQRQNFSTIWSSRLLIGSGSQIRWLQEIPASQSCLWYYRSRLDFTFLLPIPPIPVSWGCCRMWQYGRSSMVGKSPKWGAMVVSYHQTPPAFTLQPCPRAIRSSPTRILTTARWYISNPLHAIILAMHIKHPIP
jgi:hypothetical protein